MKVSRNLVVVIINSQMAFDGCLTIFLHNDDLHFVRSVERNHYNIRNYIYNGG